MKGPDGFVQAYNVQVAVDELQLIVGQAVTQETNDKKQLMPMITTIEQQSGDTPSQLLADAGYCSDENLTAIADTTIDAYISTRKQKHGERPGPCPRGPLPKTATIVDRMSRKLHTQGRRGRLRGAQSDRRTGDRPDQTGAWLPAILVAGIREGARRMVAGVHDAQHSQAVSPLRLTGPADIVSLALGRATPPAWPSPESGDDSVDGRAARGECDHHGDYSDGLLGHEGDSGVSAFQPPRNARYRPMVRFPDRSRPH